MLDWLQMMAIADVWRDLEQVLLKLMVVVVVVVVVGGGAAVVVVVAGGSGKWQAVYIGQEEIYISDVCGLSGSGGR
jgi:hypothetical protein